MSSEQKSKDQIFYLPLSDRPPTKGFRELLENYSKIPEDKVNQHIEAVRDDAWNHYPYPSIGIFIFCDLGLSGDDLPKDSTGITQKHQSAYQTILSKLKNGGKFLDVGCMFAQDARKLVFDGASPSSVYGTDILGDYFEFGYKLFRDKDIIPPSHFITADILDPDAPGLKELQGKLDVINNMHLLHVFSIEDQHAVLKRFIQLLKPEKGVTVTGRCSGHVQSGYRGGAHTKATTKSKGDIWEHNPDSIKKLWSEVGKDTGTEWDVQSWLWQFGSHTAGFKEGWFREPEHGTTTFIVTRMK